MAETPTSDEWQTAAKFCNRMTAMNGVGSAIKRGIRRGKHREPRHHRIIVHPEFPWHPDIFGDDSLPAVKQGNANFAMAIHRILEHQPDAIVVRHQGTPYAEDFPHPRTIHTASRSEVGGAIVGDLDAQGAKDLLELTEGIHPEDTFTIDGAALNRCPIRTAQQIYGLMRWQTFIPPSSTALREDHPRLVHSTAMRKVMFQLDLLRSAFRFGVIHDTFDEKTLKGSSCDLFHPEMVIMPREAGDLM